MKKQNVNNKLAFNKAAVMELNDQQLKDINGGITPVISFVVWSSTVCGNIALGAATIVYLAVKQK